MFFMIYGSNPFSITFTLIFFITSTQNNITNTSAITYLSFSDITFFFHSMTPFQYGVYGTILYFKIPLYLQNHSISFSVLFILIFTPQDLQFIMFSTKCEDACISTINLTITNNNSSTFFTHPEIESKTFLFFLSSKHF